MNVKVECQNFIKTSQQRGERIKLGKDPQGPSLCFIFIPETDKERGPLGFNGYAERHIYCWGPITLIDWKDQQSGADFIQVDTQEEFCPKCKVRRLVATDGIYFNELGGFHQVPTGKEMGILTLKCPAFNCGYAREVDRTHGIIIKDKF